MIKAIEDAAGGVVEPKTGTAITGKKQSITDYASGGDMHGGISGYVRQKNQNNADIENSLKEEVFSKSGNSLQNPRM